MSAGMARPGSILWFARHELRLSLRDFLAMMTAGKRQREGRVAIFLLGAAAVLHLIAWGVLGPALRGERGDPLQLLVMVTAIMILPFSLMASQAMESVTRVFYSRSDLDLVLASPASARRILAVRIGAIALSTSMLSLLLAAPAINVLAVLDHPGWLAAYPTMLALGVAASVIALALTMSLFRLIGARRTRTAAQIVAALVGATFVIGIQLAAIASMGTLSRLQFLQSDAVRAHAPAPDSALWLPARAAMGDPVALLGVVAFAGLLFAAAIIGFSGVFGERVLAAAGISQQRRASPRIARSFRRHNVASALRYKEWKLLARDHWLLSQTLMQVLYLVPPAFMLWRGFGAAGGAPVVVIPVLVMAAGQLAGGLAWLAISGEDAPQLVATAPVGEGAVIRAKTEAVLCVIGLVVSPILITVALIDPLGALAALAGIAAAATSATAIQLWFRSQARRSNFRRRQTSSRLATFAEAFSSIFWAGSAGLLAAGSLWTVLPVLGAVAVLATARAFRPQTAREFAF